MKLIELHEKDVNVLLNNFYSVYFSDYLEEVIEDHENELSVVTLFRGMDYFISLCQKYEIDFPFSSKREYIESVYEDGIEIYLMLQKRYDSEIIDYYAQEISFREANSKLEFNCTLQ